MLLHHRRMFDNFFFVLFFPLLSYLRFLAGCERSSAAAKAADAWRVLSNGLSVSIILLSFSTFFSKGRWGENLTVEEFYPIISFLNFSNCGLGKHLVNMSLQFAAEATFCTVNHPSRIWSLKWCHLILIWRVCERCLFSSSRAKATQLALSSNITDFPSEVIKLEEPSHKRLDPGISKTSLMFLSNRRSGIKTRAHWLRAMYSALKVLNAISDSSLECHKLEHPL